MSGRARSEWLRQKVRWAGEGEGEGYWGGFLGSHHLKQISQRQEEDDISKVFTML